MSALSAAIQLDGSPVDVEAIRAMVAQQRLQGPDGDGVWSDGSAALGNNLFRATLESRLETQPCSLDGVVWITADVFLTGRRELVDALKSAGRDVSLDQPDPELILHAYHVWGLAFLERLLGYFAFILWDSRAKRVVAARDHFGNRTLYYAQRGPTLVLSGFLDAVADHPTVKAELSEFHVACFLGLGSVNRLDLAGTAYAGIRKLLPAECLVAEAGSVRTYRYWECPVEVPLWKYRCEEEVLEHYRDLLAHVIEDHLRTRRLVLTVSGGMDSTTVTAMTATVLRKRGYGPELVGFCQDHRVINHTDEARLAEMLCRQYDLPLTCMVMDEVPWLTPDYRPVTLMMYPLANQQQEFVRRAGQLGEAVMFGSSGDWLRSATFRDALLGGNPFRALSGFVAAWRRHGIRPELSFGLHQGVRAIFGNRSDYAPNFPEWLRPEIVARHDLDRAYRETRWKETQKPSRLNRRHPKLQLWVQNKDNGTIFHGNAPDVPFEGLDPLGDRRILTFFLGLPLLPWFANKFLQREAMQPQLPKAIWQRPRTAIRSHHRPFFNNSRNQWVEEVMYKQFVSEYLKKSYFPKASAFSSPMGVRLVALRPWVLDRWDRSQR